jgi:hypothetical protein
MPKSTRPLTPLMTEAIVSAEERQDGKVIITAGTSAATGKGLRDRGLVTAGWELTETGKRLWENLTETQRAKALKEQDERAELNSAEEIAELEELGLIADPLEVPTPPSPAQQAATEGDRYMSTGPGADVKARDAQVISDFGTDHQIHLYAERFAQELPQRVPAVALTEELTGERVPDVPAATKGVRYRPSVSLRPLIGEVVERATPETFVAVGALWGRLEGRRVRIVAMDGDVFHRNNLTFVEAGPGEPSWSMLGEHTVHLPVALHEGTTVLVDGYQLYRVGISPLAGQGPKLWPVRS